MNMYIWNTMYSDKVAVCVVLQSIELLKRESHIEQVFCTLNTMI